MLKVKKTTCRSIPKNNELTKLTKEEKNKTINDYAKLIQSIKREYQKLALENNLLKKK